MKIKKILFYSIGKNFLFFYFSTLLTNLGVYITKPEMNGLFNTMDIDKNGKIDIDEFLFFLANNQTECDPDLSKTLLNVRIYNR